MSVGQDHSEDDDARAGEYVLRVLSPEDEAAFAARLAQEPSLRRLVADWEDALAVLADEVQDVPPPPAVFAQIEERLFAEAAPEPSRLARMFSLRFWGGAAIGLAMLGAVIVVVPELLPTPGPSYTAEITAEDASLIVTASFDARSNTLNVTRTAGGPRDGRTLELWIIADGASAPISLGIIEAAQVAVSISAEINTLLAGAVLAISDEPLGGSPTGAPTGDVLAIGAISEA